MNYVTWLAGEGGRVLCVTARHSGILEEEGGLKTPKIVYHNL